jgi:hypothetical protein
MVGHPKAARRVFFHEVGPRIEGLP